MIFCQEVKIAKNCKKTSYFYIFVSLDFKELFLVRYYAQILHAILVKVTFGYGIISRQRVLYFGIVKKCAL